MCLGGVLEASQELVFAGEVADGLEHDADSRLDVVAFDNDVEGRDILRLQRVAHGEQEFAGSAFVDGGHRQDCRCFHGGSQNLRSLEFQPGDLVLFGHGNRRRFAFAVEGVFRIGDADMEREVAFACCHDQSRCHEVVGHRRVTGRDDHVGGAVAAHRSGGHDIVTQPNLVVEAATRSETDEGVNTQVRQLLRGDGGRRTANAGGSHSDEGVRLAFFTREGAHPGVVLSVVGDLVGVAQMLGDQLHSSGVSGQDCDLSQALGTVHVDVMLVFLLHWRLLAGDTGTWVKLSLPCVIVK